MHRAVRVFLAWVVAFAVPMQGMAAASMAFCGPSHERMMQGLVQHAPAVASSQAEAHEHHTAAAAHHPAGHDHPLQRAAAAEAVDGLSPEHSQFSCSVCAACCSVLALPSGFSLPKASGLLQLMSTAQSTPVPSTRFDGLERPPRSDRA